MQRKKQHTKSNDAKKERKREMIHTIIKCRPPTPALELGRSSVQRRRARGAGVDTFGGVVFIVLAFEGCFGAFLAEDLELLMMGRENQGSKVGNAVSRQFSVSYRHASCI